MSWILQTRDSVIASGIFSFTKYLIPKLRSCLLCFWKTHVFALTLIELLYLSVIPPNPKELPDGCN